MRQSTADIIPGGSEPWTWWPRFGPADDIPTARQPSYHHWVLNTCPDIEMSIALRYHAWFVGHQTECKVSAGRLPDSKCLARCRGEGFRMPAHRDLSTRAEGRCSKAPQEGTRGGPCWAACPLWGFDGGAPMR